MGWNAASTATCFSLYNAFIAVQVDSPLIDLFAVNNQSVPMLFYALISSLISSLNQHSLDFSNHPKEKEYKDKEENNQM